MDNSQESKFVGDALPFVLKNLPQTNDYSLVISYILFVAESVDGLDTDALIATSKRDLREVKGDGAFTQTLDEIREMLAMLNRVQEMKKSPL